MSISNLRPRIRRDRPINVVPATEMGRVGRSSDCRTGTCARKDLYRPLRRPIAQSELLALIVYVHGEPEREKPVAMENTPTLYGIRLLDWKTTRLPSILITG